MSLSELTTWDHGPGAPGAATAVAEREPVASPAPDRTGGAPAAPGAERQADLWPHTRRVQPWLVAAFIAMLWLVPFNTIKLRFSGPVDMELDRLLLPVLVGAWVVAQIFGGRNRPRLKMTAPHYAFGTFVLICAMSIVVNVHVLNQTRELDEAIKQLLTIFAYLTFFVLMTSIVRPGEVRAFLKFTFILAIVASLGTIWEYNTNYNVFYDLSSKIFIPKLFVVPSTYQLGAVDEIGRRLIRGPAQHGLELTSMLAMALPIAVVGLIEAKKTRTRLGYALAMTLFLAAAIATFRKTSIIAPVTAIAVLVFFRPRRLLRLAPLGLVIFVLVHVLSPGAFGSVLIQFNSHRLHSVSTVNDRTADYDAVRPDVFLHPILGRGYGAYSEQRYRILDNQLLGYLVMIGVVGLLSYMAIMASVVAVARRWIRGRDPTTATPHLIAASAAVVFLVVSQLFDSMAFPHAPYVFLSLAALAAASTYPTERHDEVPPR
ncbi:MAG TPA: O-antigen ligase family protein [Baekduia sp.]|uniref:O-antigen ligase family protein n=1 Tax=Baekduia sp. TaxID=2600305 RepID=UPI002D7A0B0E|nr:O-antigen ligase family protein [Baekduia sp.]HET6508242.1 O-antigen ligase family protein [Baekduia sp.]